ncbi:MAG: tyrosine-type recombinase/integrase [Gaiellaceae bacterium]
MTHAEWEAIFHGRIKDHSYQSETRLGPLVVDFLAWLSLARRADKTLDQYERDLALGCLLFPQKTVSEWTSEDMLHVLGRFPPGSQKRAAAPWRRFWKWAIVWGHVEANPMDRLPEIKAPPRKVIEVFTEPEEELLVSQAELRDTALMMVLLDTGIRKGEARHLCGSHVDLDRGRLVIRQGAKGGKHRIVPIAGQLVTTLADLLLTEGIGGEDHLWYTTAANQHGQRVMRHRPIGEGTFHRWWAACVAYAGVPYRKPHTTRHTFATKWLRDGGGVVELSKILGHASVKTTIDEYAHLVTEDIAAELSRLLEMRAAR